MRNCICIVLVVCIFVVGCGGRTPFPVQVAQSHDRSMSCAGLAAEMSSIQRQVHHKTGQTNQTDAANAVELTVGLFLFWPALLFIDISNADQIELEALEARYNYLRHVYASKSCY